MVCLLTGRHALLRELLYELHDLVRSCAERLTDGDHSTWQLVHREFDAFLGAVEPLTVMPSPSERVALEAGPGSVEQQPSMRLRPPLVQPQEALVAGLTRPPYRLAQAILACTAPGQLKVSEMPIDLYRMAQAVEWDSQALKASADDGPDSVRGLQNPLKYMLYRASFAQLSLVLSTALVELDASDALLLYLSADAWQPAAPAPATTSSAEGGAAAAMAGATAAAGAAGVGSLIGEATSGIALAVSAESEVAVRSCCLSPLDLLPFCRVPLLVVVESDASHAFASFATVAARPSGFHRPLVCLLAPCPPPDAPRKAKAQLASLTQLAGGGALSLFLHDEEDSLNRFP